MQQTTTIHHTSRAPSVPNARAIPSQPAPLGSYTRTLAILGAAVFVYSMLQGLTTPVLTAIQHDLGTTPNNVTWVVTSYLLAAAVLTPIIGRLGDLHGRKRVLLVTLTVLMIGCVISALAPNLPIMLLGRIVQGTGGGVLPLAFGIARDQAPATRVNSGIGTLAALAAVGAGAGISLAGVIVSVSNVHTLFWLPAALLAVTMAAAIRALPASTPSASGALDIVSGTLLAAWLVLLLYPVSEASTWGWSSPATVTLLVAAVPAFAAWIRWESRSKAPLVDLSLMRRKAVWTTNLATALIGVGMFAGFAFLPRLLQHSPQEGYGFGASVAVSGVLLLPSSVAMFLAGMVFGGVSRRWGTRAVLVFGCVIEAAGFATLAFAHDALWQVLVAMILQGGGTGLAFAAVSALTVDAVPSTQAGLASGINTNVRTIGGAIGTALVGTIIGATARGSGGPTEAGFDHAFLLLSVAGVLAAAAALAVPGRHVRRQPDSANRIVPSRS